LLDTILLLLQTESWNGTSWTALPGAINTGRRGVGSAGLQTAALLFGGASPTAPGKRNESESWNGTSWTNTPSMNTAKK
jgi:hypothetical protein